MISLIDPIGFGPLREGVRRARGRHWAVAVVVSLLLLPATASGARDCAQPAPGCPIGEDCQWHADGVLNIGYRPDAPPFSWSKPTMAPKMVRPAGYSVEICRQIAGDIGAKFHRDHPNERLAVRWVPIDAQSRFTCLRNGHIDMLCGTATVTLRRMREFESSLFTFLTGASFMCRGLGNVSGDAFKQLEGKNLAYVRGSTTLAVMDRERERHGIRFGGTCPQRSYTDAIESLLQGLDESACSEKGSKDKEAADPDSTESEPSAPENSGIKLAEKPDDPATIASDAPPDTENLSAHDASGQKTDNAPPASETDANAEPAEDRTVDCVVGDRDVLNDYYQRMPSCQQGLVHLDRNYHSMEPYAIFVRRGDDPELLYDINRRLVELFREKESARNSIKSIFSDFFGTSGMSDYLKKLFEVQRLAIGQASDPAPEEICVMPSAPKTPAKEPAQDQATPAEKGQGQKEESGKTDAAGTDR